jgi:pimeloyl-ACP methyl ester carboxylesterase
MAVAAKTKRNLFQSLQGGAMGALKVIHPVTGFTGGQYRYQSVLNGLIGDSLEEEKHPLAVEMELLGKDQGSRLCILVHGLFDNEHTWMFSRGPRRDYGALLKKDLGFTPLYLRYNTGLHISTNGQKLAQLLTRLFKKHPRPIREIIFIGHSMGGLVIRSACYYGKKKKAPWVPKVKKIFFLGTPHLGTDWEKIGHVTSVILQMIPNFVTKGIASLGNRRSAGIKDLRFGYLLDEDWQGQKDKIWHDNRHPVSLLEGVDYYLIASTLAKQSKNFFSEYFGDGLVPSRSASGKSIYKELVLPFLPHHCKTVKGLSHKGLTHHHRVYQQIKKWCKSRPSS